MVDVMQTAGQGLGKWTAQKRWIWRCCSAMAEAVRKVLSAIKAERWRPGRLPRPGQIERLGLRRNRDGDAG